MLCKYLCMHICVSLCMCVCMGAVALSYHELHQLFLFSADLALIVGLSVGIPAVLGLLALIVFCVHKHKNPAYG